MTPPLGGAASSVAFAALSKNCLQYKRLQLPVRQYAPVQRLGWAAADSLDGALRMQRGHASGGGGRDARQSDSLDFCSGSSRVDDESVIAQTLAVILNQAGFQATAFDHPEKSNRRYRRTKARPPHQRCDYAGMSGFELAIHFRKAQPDCKVLLFSGQAATADLLDEARNQGYDFDLLAKPIHPADLLAKLRS